MRMGDDFIPSRAFKSDRSRTPEDGRCSARCPRHTEDEIFHLGRQDLMALSDFLADNPFSMGDTATTLDATTYGLRVNVLWYPIESALKVDAESFSNLNSYCRAFVTGISRRR